MGNNDIIRGLNDLALLLDKCSDDVPYELSAKDSLYFRMVDLAKEARSLAQEAQEQ